MDSFISIFLRIYKIFSIVKEGSVKVIKNFNEKNETEISKIEEMDFFGEMMLIEMVARSATIVSDGDVTLYRIHASDIMALIHEDIKAYSILILNIARDLCRRLRSLDEEFVKAKSQ